MSHQHARLLLQNAVTLLRGRGVFLGLWRLGQEPGRLHVVLQLVFRFELDLVQGSTAFCVPVGVDLDNLDLVEDPLQT